MKTAALLKDIIDQITLFEQENPHLKEYHLDDFLVYMQHQRPDLSPKTSDKRSTTRHNIPQNSAHHDAIMLSRLVSLLYRYAKNYSRKALDDSPIQTIKEFSFLIVLQSEGSLTKSELIQQNVMEITSGMEVIKRLLKKKFIHQYPDPADKRSMRVAITDKGSEELFRVLPRMQNATKIIKGNLDPGEQKSLIFLLQKLEHFHETLDMTAKGDSLEDIMAEINKTQN